MSDFARTFRANAAGGTDHAWAGSQLLLGGAVKGGRFYGAPPDLRPDGPDNYSSGSVAVGRFAPTMAVQELASTLVNWMGASSARDAILPGFHGSFRTDLGCLA